MAHTEHPMQALAAYLPDSSFDEVVQYLHQYKVHLTVMRERKSVLGDYRNAVWQKPPYKCKRQPQQICFFNNPNS